MPTTRTLVSLNSARRARPARGLTTFKERTVEAEISVVSAEDMMAPRTPTTMSPFNPTGARLVTAWGRADSGGIPGNCTKIIRPRSARRKESGTTPTAARMLALLAVGPSLAQSTLREAQEVRWNSGQHTRPPRSGREDKKQRGHQSPDEQNDLPGIGPDDRKLSSPEGVEHEDHGDHGKGETEGQGEHAAQEVGSSYDLSRYHTAPSDGDHHATSHLDSSPVCLAENVRKCIDLKGPDPTGQEERERNQRQPSHQRPPRPRQPSGIPETDDPHGG
jgi:hypothetical protein